MRTTLTIDDDVAARLKRLGRDRSFKELTNQALRLGLHAMESEQREAPYETEPVHGKPRVLNLDNVAEVIAENDRDDWR